MNGFQPQGGNKVKRFAAALLAGLGTGIGAHLIGENLPVREEVRAGVEGLIGVAGAVALDVAGAPEIVSVGAGAGGLGAAAARGVDAYRFSQAVARVMGGSSSGSSSGASNTNRPNGALPQYR